MRPWCGGDTYTAHPVLLESNRGRGHSHAGKAWSRSPEVKQDVVTIRPGTSDEERVSALGVCGGDGNLGLTDESPIW